MLRLFSLPVGITRSGLSDLVYREEWCIGSSRSDVLRYPRAKIKSTRYITIIEQYRLYRTIIRNNAYKCKQTDSLNHRLKDSDHLNVCILLLDTEIIPNFSSDCKEIKHYFTAFFLFDVSNCIMEFQTRMVCYNMSMNSWLTLHTDALIHLLRTRLSPIEDSELFFTRDPLTYADVRRSAVLLALFEHQQMLSLLFIRRARTLRSHSGEIAFPGGKVEAYDQSVAATAIREAHEEVLLEPHRVQVLGLLPPVLTVASNYVISPVVAYLPSGPGQLLAQESEVAELIIIPFHALADPAIAHTEQWTRASHTQTVYFYDYHSYRIWGATGRILASLLQLLNT
jgi:8-oxo-dGTP pyrophosphatase MutT (NUDIX family)